MKTILLPFLLILQITQTANSQTDFSQVFPTQSLYHYLGIENSRDTIYLVGGFRNNDLNYGLKVIKLDSTGQIIKELEIIDTAQVFTTYFYYAGFTLLDDKIYFWGTTVPDNKCYLLIIDKDFSSYVIKYFQNTNPNIQLIGNRSLLVRESDIFIMGEAQTFETFGTLNTFIIRTDIAGNEIWRNYYGLSGQEDLPSCIIQKSPNELIIGGWRRSPMFNQQLPASKRWGHNWMFAIDTLGNVLWEWEEKDSQHHSGVNSLYIIDGNYYFTGGLVWFTTIGFDAQAYVRSLDKDFKERWRYMVPNESPFSKLNGVSMTMLQDSNHFVAAGYNYDGFPAPHVKLTLDGELVYYRLDSICADAIGVKDVGFIGLSDITALSSGSTVACGLAGVLLPAGWTNRAWVMKVKASGEADSLACGVWVPTDEPTRAIKTLHIFPNPASESTQIEIPKLTENYQLRCTDWAGRLQLEMQIGTVENPVLQISDWRAGVYFVQILDETGRVLAVGKLVKT